MSPGVLFLLIVCIWPASNTDTPKVLDAGQPTLAICQANAAIVKAKLQSDPSVRFVDAQCVELDNGNKS